MFCIDASVILSAAKGTEVYSQKSTEFLEMIDRESYKIFFPEIILPEIASGLVRQTGDEKLAAEYIENLSAVSNFSFVPVDSKLTALAVKIILKTKLRAADALYVALAYEYNLTLVTLDEEQLQRSAELVSVRRP